MKLKKTLMKALSLSILNVSTANVVFAAESEFEAYREVISNENSTLDIVKATIVNYLIKIKASGNIAENDLLFIRSAYSKHESEFEGDGQVAFLNGDINSMSGNNDVAYGYYTKAMEFANNSKLYDASFIAALRISSMHMSNQNTLKLFSQGLSKAGRGGQFYGSIMVIPTLIDSGAYQAALDRSVHLLELSFDDRSSEIATKSLVNTVRAVYLNAPNEAFANEGLTQLDLAVYEAVIATFTVEKQWRIESDIAWHFSQNGGNLSDLERLKLSVYSIDKLEQHNMFKDAVEQTTTLADLEQRNTGVDSPTSAWFSENAIKYAEYALIFSEENDRKSNVLTILATLDVNKLSQLDRYYVLLGDVYYAEDDFDTAISYYRQAISVSEVQNRDTSKKLLAALFKSGDEASVVEEINQYFTGGLFSNANEEHDYQLNLLSIIMEANPILGQQSSDEILYHIYHNSDLTTQNKLDYFERAINQRYLSQDFHRVEDYLFAAIQLSLDLGNSELSTKYRNQYTEAMISSSTSYLEKNTMLDVAYAFNVTQDDASLSRYAAQLIEHQKVEPLELLFENYLDESIVGMQSQHEKYQLLFTEYEKLGDLENSRRILDWLVVNAQTPKERKSYHGMILSRFDDNFSQEFFEESGRYLNLYPALDDFDLRVLEANIKYDVLAEGNESRIRELSVYSNNDYLTDIVSFYNVDFLVSRIERLNVNGVGDIRSYLLEVKAAISELNSLRARLSNDPEYSMIIDYHSFRLNQLVVKQFQSLQEALEPAVAEQLGTFEAQFLKQAVSSLKRIDEVHVRQLASSYSQTIFSEINNTIEYEHVQGEGDYAEL